MTISKYSLEFLLNTLQYTGQPCTTKNDLSPDVSSGKVENPQPRVSRASVGIAEMAEVTRWLRLLSTLSFFQ